MTKRLIDQGDTLKIGKKTRLLGVAIIGALALTGCSMAAATDEVAVHYGGGPFEGKKPKGCIDSSEREVQKPGDSYFFYPASQSTYDFSGDDDSDASPIPVVSSDNQPLAIAGQINFSLVTNCDDLTEFHDKIGKRYEAFMTPGEKGLVRSDGWRKMMRLYIGRAATDTLSRVAKQFTWRELYSDPSVKDKMNSEINKTIAQMVNQQTEGDTVFFDGYSALVQQPQPDQALIDSLKAEEQGKAAAAAAEAKAVADAAAAEAAAQAQIAQKEAEAAVAQKEAERQAAEIAPFGSPEQYNYHKAIEKGLNPWQPVYGSGTIVDAK